MPFAPVRTGPPSIPTGPAGPPKGPAAMGYARVSGILDGLGDVRPVDWLRCRQINPWLELRVRLLDHPNLEGSAQWIAF